MGKFHIVITDNETGETKCEYDTNAIVAGVDTEGSVHGINCTHCKPTTLASVLDCVVRVIRENLQSHPELGTLMLLAAQKNKPCEGKLDTEN